jgi:hypothetical protein
MAVSSQEIIRLRCPNCQRAVDASVWTLVDAAERPDLAASLRDETLNIAVCPSCGQQWPASVPMLYHDPANRRVYFAVPADTEEHQWRERAQELLYALVGELPEDQRLPYLGDVQLEQEVAGVRRAVMRRERVRRGEGPAQPSFGKSVETVIGALKPTARDPVAPPPPPAPAAPAAAPVDSELADAVRDLLAADDEAEFDAILAANPTLLTDDGDALVRQLAEAAYGDDRAVSDALRELRATLTRMRSGGPALPEPQPAPIAEPEAEAIAAARLAPLAFQALLHTSSPETLADAARDYPQLLEHWADDELFARMEAALEEGNERLAQAIDDRREELATLREELGSPAALQAALNALLAAQGDDARAEVLAAYPIVLTERAQAALQSLAQQAERQGNQQLASNAAASRELLRTVRAGLEEQ